MEELATFVVIANVFLLSVELIAKKLLIVWEFLEEMQQTTCVVATRETKLALDVMESHSERSTTSVEFAVEMVHLATTFATIPNALTVLVLKAVHGACTQLLQDLLMLASTLQKTTQHNVQHSSLTTPTVDSSSQHLLLQELHLVLLL